MDDEDEDEEDDSAAKPLKTTFELNDTLFAEAEITDSDTVYLWLGVCPLPPLDTSHLNMATRRQT